AAPRLLVRPGAEPRRPGHGHPDQDGWRFDGRSVADGVALLGRDGDAAGLGDSLAALVSTPPEPRAVLVSFRTAAACDPAVARRLRAAVQQRPRRVSCRAWC